MLYQLSYTGVLYGGFGRNRTADTRIFSPLLYQLSYKAVCSMIDFKIKMAVSTGFEPAIFCVTGRHVNPYTTRPDLIAGAGFEPTTFGL